MKKLGGCVAGRARGAGAEENYTDEERRALSLHIEEGYQQAERGELVDGAHAQRDVQAMKDSWRKARSPAQ